MRIIKEPYDQWQEVNPSDGEVGGPQAKTPQAPWLLRQVTLQPGGLGSPYDLGWARKAIPSMD